MKRVEADEMWSLFCPNEAKPLFDSYGEKFNQLYEEYERIPGKPKKVVKARVVWQAILESQIETGTPYMMYKVSNAINIINRIIVKLNLTIYIR